MANNKSVSNDFTIIIPTHSDYQNVVKNFLQILKKNWSSCPYKIVVSSIGENNKIESVENLYNGEKGSLIDCVVNVTKKSSSNYFIVFLGDSFISQEVDDKKINDILFSIKDNDIDYCSLKYVKNYEKVKSFNENLRYINNLDRYSHNFVAFAASKSFIQNEMANFKTDLDFEKYYLHKNENNSFYYDKHLIVKKNYLNILSGITGGKWDRINLSKLKKLNPEISFDDRKILSWKESILRHARNHIVSHIGSSTRVKLKSVVEKTFKIKFGVKD